MKQSVKISMCGIFAALAVVTMLLSYFPYLTYAVPAIAGLFIMIIVMEIDCKWALAAYIVSSFLVFIFAEPESKLLYVFLFGYYPILKCVIEKINKNVIEWILKLLVFNVAVLLVYYIFSGMFGISTEDFNVLGKYGALIFLLTGNIVFVLYDFAVSRMALFYYNTIHRKISKMFKL